MSGKRSSNRIHIFVYEGFLFILQGNIVYDTSVDVYNGVSRYHRVIEHAVCDFE